MTTNDVATPVPDAADTSKVATGELPWAELLPGMEVRLLRIGEGTGVYTVETRFAPGTSIPTHHHHGPVHAWTVSGRWGYREYPWVAEAGDYIYEEAGSTHTLFVPDEGIEPAVVVFVIEGPQDYLDADGNVFFTQTAQTVVEFYQAKLAEQSLDMPTAILA